jgi:hypothetical protein
LVIPEFADADEDGGGLFTGLKCLPAPPENIGGPLGSVVEPLVTGAGSTAGSSPDFITRLVGRDGALPDTLPPPPPPPPPDG